jgi:hypothetical protein
MDLTEKNFRESTTGISNSNRFTKRNAISPYHHLDPYMTGSSECLPFFLTFFKGDNFCRDGFLSTKFHNVTEDVNISLRVQRGKTDQFYFSYE